MNGHGDYGAWTDDDFDEYETREEAWQDAMATADTAASTYWPEYFDDLGQNNKAAREHVELFTRWEHELSLPDTYGNRAYTHWFVEVAL